jgi:hypothetical protein
MTLHMNGQLLILKRSFMKVQIFEVAGARDHLVDYVDRVVSIGDNVQLEHVGKYCIEAPPDVMQKA